LLLGGLLCLTTLSLLSGAIDKLQLVLIVFAAVSLTNALRDISAAFTKESALPVRFTFGASSMLAKMIDATQLPKLARLPMSSSQPILAALGPLMDGH
jgi:ABC-type molybdate transport system substrate-binding protein